ncbi:MAG: hypothetical protein KGJ13_09960 [Patescibacteria group bacterium]|nr:hypothetical protein [Patescibacteria group bacterium]
MLHENGKGKGENAPGVPEVMTRNHTGHRVGQDPIAKARALESRVMARKRELWDRCGTQLQVFIKQGVADGLSFLPPIFDHDSAGEMVYVVK